LEEAGDAAEAAIALVEDRMQAFMACLQRDPRVPWPPLPPALGGEYVSAEAVAHAIALNVSVHVTPSYKLQQIEAVRGTIAGCRRHLKHLLGITK
jgi:hypothetical protein